MTFNGSTFEDPGCGLRVYTPATCPNCSGDLNLTTIATCFCNHLVPTGLSLIYDTPPVLDPLDTLALPFYGDRFQVNHWAESLGFRVAIAAGIVYAVGLLIAIVVDIKPRKSLILRLMKDLRDIDRFGLAQHQAVSEEDSMLEDTPQSEKPKPRDPVGETLKDSRQGQRSQSKGKGAEYEGGDGEEEGKEALPSSQV